VVEEPISEGILARVIVGGILKPRKGFSAEGLSVSSTGLSAKDKGDIEIMLEEGTDALAVSFVQNAKDIDAVRNELPKNSRIMLIAKIETKAGIENAEEILGVADGLMVARGDMGLAVPIADVPHIQKKLINLCLKYEKPVITATQMLESMVNIPMPTRAEVTDVANAILDGTDAVMLSAETASGKFPVETVHMMVKIIIKALEHTTVREFNDEHEIGSAVSGSVGWIADHIGAKLVIAFTESGRCARRISRTRHPQTIIALSPNQHTIHNLNFSWGVHPKHIHSTSHFDNMREQAKDFAKQNGIVELEKNEPFVIAAGMPFGATGSTNMVYVEKA
jgi:pyruvate kinase